MVCVRNVFQKYGLGARHLSENNMVRVRNVFLKYEHGGGGRNIFPMYRAGAKVFSKYQLGAKRLTK